MINHVTLTTNISSILQYWNLLVFLPFFFFFFVISSLCLKPNSKAWLQQTYDYLYNNWDIWLQNAFESPLDFC